MAVRCSAIETGDFKFYIEYQNNVGYNIKTTLEIIMLIEAESVLEAIIEKFNLSETAEITKHQNTGRHDNDYTIALKQIQSLLSGEENTSETIYVPGGAGVVRVSLEVIEPNTVSVQSVGFTPPGSPKEFVYKQHSQSLTHH